MRVVLLGGSGHVGSILQRALRAEGHDVVVIGRGDGSTVHWDGRTLGPWATTIDGADVVVNLAGRSVDCRYDKTNLTEMLVSRVDSTRVLGEAIAAARRPPPVWLQMSTATIYAHAGPANDETHGVLGGNEAGVPAYWRYSVEIARAWERALAEADTPRTRKIALRTAMVMGNERGGVFDMLLRLTRLGLGGAIAGGGQYVSWIHAEDFARAVSFLIEHEELDGVFNLSAPEPLPQREFMAALRAAAHVPIGLPASRWMVQAGAALMRTDPELVLKSRRVLPQRLEEAGFRFEHPRWSEACRDLLERRRSAAA